MYDILAKMFPEYDTEKVLDLLEIQWGYDTIYDLLAERDMSTLACLLEECINENTTLVQWE